MSRTTRLSGWFVGCMCVGAGLGCGGESAEPAVKYADGAPIGAWQTSGTATAPNLASAAAGAQVPASAGPVAGAPPGPASSISPSAPVPNFSTPPAVGAAPAAPSMAQAAAGRVAPTGAAGSAGGTSAKPPVSSAGAGAGAPPAEQAGGIKSLAFEVTTSPCGMRYQPKNIGAIWIQDSSGTLVKSLKVWARTRARWLTKYSAARGGQAVDVTASATLNSHQTHTVTWDLRDRSGAAVMPGKYTLFAEVTDGDATGKLTSVEFDTSAPPKAVNPPDAPSFNSMKLELK